MNPHSSSHQPSVQSFILAKRLSLRELELLTLLNKGCRVREAAQMMDIQETTARTLAVRAYKKLGANNLQTALYEARELILVK